MVIILFVFFVNKVIILISMLIISVLEGVWKCLCIWFRFFGVKFIWLNLKVVWLVVRMMLWKEVIKLNRLIKVIVLYIKCFCLSVMFKVNGSGEFEVFVLGFGYIIVF